MPAECPEEEIHIYPVDLTSNFSNSFIIEEGVVPLVDFGIFLWEFFRMMKLRVTFKVLHHFQDIADWVTAERELYSPLCMGPYIDPLSFWDIQKYVATDICHFLVSGHSLGLLMRILYPEHYLCLLQRSTQSYAWSEATPMLQFQTKGGVVICSFPLLEHCYCMLHNHFSLGSTYESLSLGAKARIDGVSYQCSSGKLTSEAVDTLLSQMEMHNGIPGGVDLSGDVFEVDYIAAMVASMPVLRERLPINS